ncbi:MAG: BatA domain-containing protein, partial [Saprospiraceae bacterium]
MQFVNPWFLAALGTLAIPIIIHLFYFRRYKKVFFSSVRFLKEVKDETSARSKLKNLLVLISRLLALAFIVMAFAQPFKRITTKDQFAQNLIGIFVDNSYSMNALSQDIPLISKAKQRARTIIESYDDQDRFVILTHDFSGRQLRLVHKEEGLNMVDEIIATPTIHNLSEVSTKIESILSKAEGNKHLFLISDFQKTISDLSVNPDTIIQSHLIPLQSVQERNIAIDTAWFESPAQWLGEANLLFFKVHNYGDQPVQEARLSLLQNNQIKPLGTINLQAGESHIDTAEIMIEKPGWQEIQLEVTDFPVQFDDKLFLAFNVNAKINILVISREQVNTYLTSAIQSLPTVNLSTQSIKNVNYAAISQNHLIILDDLNEISSGLANELMSALRQGSNVLLFPGATADIRSFNNFFSLAGVGSITGFEKRVSPVANINTLEFTFKDVYNKIKPNMKLPTVQGRFNRIRGIKGEENILSFADEQAYITKSKIENGSLYISASPLHSDWSDLSRNPEIFVPMILRMALNKNVADKIVRFIGRDESIEINHIRKADENTYHLNKSKSEDIIPYQRSSGIKTILEMKGAIKEAGIYQINLKDSLISKTSFNYDRKESDLSTYSLDELNSLFGNNYEVIDKSDTAAFDSWFKNNQ